MKDPYAIAEAERFSVIDRLVIAAANGNVVALERAIASGAPAQIGLHAVSHVMSAACWENKVEAMRAWLPVFVPGHHRKGQSEHEAAIEVAASRGHAEALSVLLPVYRQGKDLDYALHCASSAGHAGIVRTLLDVGANPLATMGSALVAATSRNRLDVIAILAPLCDVPSCIEQLSLRQCEGVNALRAYHQSTLIDQSTPAVPAVSSTRQASGLRRI